MANKTYNFGEKKEEYINGKKIPVEWLTPKYNEAKKKVIETLESKKYKDVLEESDFWILVNTYANKTKAMYSGLIISHNGCLKINDILENKFKPECLIIDKDGFNDSLVFTYQDEEIYEVGEVSKTNCKNAYPYAMALKRCFDRVVLKKSKLAYAGVYSDSEAEEFSKNDEEKPTEKKSTKTTRTTKKTEEKKEAEDKTDYKKILASKLKEKGEDEFKKFCVKHKLNAKTPQAECKKLLESLGD